MDEADKQDLINAFQVFRILCVIIVVVELIIVLVVGLGTIVIGLSGAESMPSEIIAP